MTCSKLIILTTFQKTSKKEMIDNKNNKNKKGLFLIFDSFGDLKINYYD